jgi:hypothetical protein
MKDWRNTYGAQVAHTASRLGMIRHLRIWRIDRKPIMCQWDVLQRIKNDMLGPEVQAVEVYPPVDELVNETNMRHLWEIPPDTIPSFLSRY